MYILQNRINSQSRALGSSFSLLLPSSSTYVGNIEFKKGYFDVGGGDIFTVGDILTGYQSLHQG